MHYVPPGYMHLIERLNRELGYNAWANREAPRSLLAAKTVPDRAAAVMAHIVRAEWLWLSDWDASPLKQSLARSVAMLHSSYHRGQIASLLGRAGGQAAYTDYIEYVRRGYFRGGS